MTTQETKRNAIDQGALDAKGNSRLDAYRIQLGLFKLQNDNCQVADRFLKCNLLDVSLLLDLPLYFPFSSGIMQSP